ncbi:hypothetical protein Ancab_030797 [Ancistrocladus abbreviatus]
MERYMDNDLYNAAREGNSDFLYEIRMVQSETGEEVMDESYFITSTADTGGNILHIASLHGHIEFIKNAIQQLPVLVLLICRSNSKGDNPLHVAANLGHHDIVKLLIDSYKSYLEDIEGAKRRSTLLTLMIAEEGIATDPWSAQNSSGDTPLHLALRNEHQEEAMHLLGTDPNLACYTNNRGESPLYIAAAYGMEEVLEKILTSDMPYSTSGPGGATPLHAAIYGSTEKAVKLLLEKRAELVKAADNQKRTALHFAAERGPEWPIELLLKQDKSCAYLRDAEGLTPLLRASTLGHIGVVSAILVHCLPSIAICDIAGRTMLHLMKLPSYQAGVELLKFPAIRRLINKPDQEGNTPLHLAVKNGNHDMVNVLLSDSDIEPTVKNGEGFTAWDLIKSQPDASENMAKIGYTLIMHTRERQLDTDSQRNSSPEDPRMQADTDTEQNHHRNHHPEDSRERLDCQFNTVSVIAAILAAVSFAAIFALPGGFDGLGGALLAGKAVFKAFVLSNASALSGYLLVLFCSLWAMIIARQDDDPKLLLLISITVLQLSFYATLVAFATGFYATTSAKTLWVAIVAVCLPGCVAILAASLSFVLYFPRIFQTLKIGSGNLRMPRQHSGASQA